MAKSYELVYVNNQIFGHFDKEVFLSYSKSEKKEIFWPKNARKPL